MADWFLLRGLTREKRHWNAFPDELEKRLGAKALMLDMPGFGSENARPSPLSIAAITDDIRERWLASKPKAPMGFIALSMGGMIALDWCARYPDDFDKVVLINTSTADLSMPWKRMQLGVVPGILKSRLQRDHVVKERAVLHATTALHGTNEAVAAQWAAWAKESPPHPRGALRQVLAAIRFNMPAQMKVPALVITSAGDRLCAPSCGITLAAKLGCEHRQHPSAGHDISLDDPGWLLDEIERFLAAAHRRSA